MSQHQCSLLSKGDVGTKFTEALNDFKIFGEGREEIAGFYLGTFFLPHEFLAPEEGCVFGRDKAELSKLCVSGQGPFFWGLKMILLCPGLHSIF
jgi:hypothetical protein